ncbi:hypothetical protein TRVL_10208 [Trypanosoma vivax]|nr:hypothetical protein TRVL_10208 [Trypanosoma vivax]
MLAVIVLLVWRLHHNKTRKISHTGRPLPDFVYEERDKESLQYIPKSVVRTWRSRNFLAVVGILSPDINLRRRRRYLQRMTCWQYKGVARKRNDFTGEMLVVFKLARHPEHNYTHSRYLKEEAAYY